MYMAQDLGSRPQVTSPRLALRLFNEEVLEVEKGGLRGSSLKMRRNYLVCQGCGQSWLWEDRLLQKPNMKCNLCGQQWKQRQLPDLRKRRVQWASWNFTNKAEQWPKRSLKEVLVSPPPGLYGGKPPKKNKGKVKGIEKKLQEHWTSIPEALRSQLEALGIKAAEPAPPPDLPTLIKEHLQSLPTDLKEAVEKIVEPQKSEPPLNQKVKQAVGTLKQVSEKKTSIQGKADTVKQQYTQLLQDLKEIQGKIEAAQKELQEATHLYNQQLEKDKEKAADETMQDEITAENLLTVMASLGMQVSAEQAKEFASKLGENVMKRRKCG